jgi:hypothetical protein
VDFSLKGSGDSEVLVASPAITTGLEVGMLPCWRAAPLQGGAAQLRTGTGSGDRSCVFEGVSGSVKEGVTRQRKRG